ncbi:CPBP family intramembrane glutamic endopeptidase [Curtobacterium ammoniigenes]|uniref:CPBP family intramembrane glutamic endopeptidase n=1 Tax=Curtobacterium ammoniigenes TaxID=395387 RepID=UPI0009F9EB0F|nr:CPBP family intramembrane glutamic endopeptidase [Curtobacterium ammoniigenes]
MTTAEPPSSEPGGRALSRVATAIVVGLLAAVLLDRLAAAIGFTSAFGAGIALAGSPTLRMLVTDLAVWVPLGVAIGIGTYWLRLPGPGWFMRTLWIRFSATDIFWGIAIAFICRAVDAFLSLGFFGTTGFGGQASVDGGPPVGELVLLVVGTCLITPVIEELFFRGLLLQWLLRRASAAGEGRGGVIASVLISAVVFGIMHVFVAQSTALGDTVEFVSTFLLGALVAAVVARTGRLGTALVAHVLFNALAVALTWP